MTSNKKWILLYIPAFLWAVLIFLLLTLPPQTFEDASVSIIPQFDKIVHAGLFGAMVFWLALPLAKRYSASSKILIWFTIASSLYGCAMEFVQKYCTSDRDFDVWDMVADTVGAILSYFCMRYIFNQYQKKKNIQIA